MIREYASRANPKGLHWSLLDFQARRDVIREREEELREMQQSVLNTVRGATGAAAPRVVGDAKYDTAHSLQADFNEAFSNQAGIGSLSVQQEPDAEELQKREHGSHEKLLGAFTQFLSLPTTDRGKLVMALMDDYQSTWMNGRKRVTVQE